MQDITLADLTRILCECAGESEVADPQGDISDMEFTDLGYDSLALLETASRIQQEYGVRLTDEAVSQARTPNELLTLVNMTAA